MGIGKKGKVKGKETGKVIPVLNEVPSHEDILEEWKYCSTYS
jgi:hypothetical protein